MLPTWCHSRVTTTKMHPVILQLLRDCTDGSLHPYMQESSEWANGSQMHATLPELKAAHPAPSIQDNGKARSSLWNVHRLIAGQSHAWFSLHLGREVVVLLIFPKTIETLNRFLGTSFNGWTSDCSPNAGPANNCHDHKTEGFVAWGKAHTDGSFKAPPKPRVKSLSKEAPLKAKTELFLT